MVPPRISLNELYQMQKKKKNTKKIVFDRILELCHKRIRNIGNFGGMNAFYEIPGLVVGYPLFNIYDCTNYIVEQLKKTGFIVQILPPPHICVLYISWDPIEMKSTNTKMLTMDKNTSILKNNEETKYIENQSKNVKKEVKWNFLLND
jgi:hypothetical protein